PLAGHGCRSHPGTSAIDPIGFSIESHESRCPCTVMAHSNDPFGWAGAGEDSRPDGGHTGRGGTRMTVVSAYVGRLKPGQLDRAVELGSLAKKVLERHGARDTRMLGVALGAESYGSTVFSTEHESNQAFGVFYDKIMADDEL